ncbi:MAG: hypothetical protein LC799_26170 [Actinobacteria bacterium]|nr:hypothetical protein [Actinomycetota bacterium]
MTAQPAPGAEFFTAPTQPNQRRYEALRAYFVERLSLAQAGARAGYTRASMASLLRDFRAGKVQMFATPATPGPKSAPAKDRARARVVELRRLGLSVYEISSRLRAEATPLNRTGVGQILAEEGFGRLLRGPEPTASASPATAGRDTHLPPGLGHRLRRGARPRRHQPGRAAADDPRPGRPGPARPGGQGRLPRHRRDPRHQRRSCRCWR